MTKAPSQGVVKGKLNHTLGISWSYVMIRSGYESTPLCTHAPTKNQTGLRHRQRGVIRQNTHVRRRAR